MRPDIYTKAVLTVIAIMLTVIAVKPIFSPEATASAQSASFAGNQVFFHEDRSFTIYDNRTGDYWQYDPRLKPGAPNNYKPENYTTYLEVHGRVTRPGSPTMPYDVINIK